MRRRKLRERVLKPTGQCLRHLPVGVVQDGRELVATVATQHIGLPQEHLGQCGAQGRNRRVTCLMAVHVVDELELVHVDHEQHHWLLRKREHLHGARDHRVEQLAVADAGERIRRAFLARFLELASKPVELRRETRVLVRLLITARLQRTFDRQYGAKHILLD